MDPNQNLNLDALAIELHSLAANQGFWDHRFDATALATKLALVHSEVSEALEELRKGKLAEPSFTEELADIVIRVLDIAGALKLPLQKAILDKHENNKQRPRKHGKLF